MDVVTEEIEAVEQERWQAMLAADTEALDRLLADELTYTHSNGLVDTKASLLDAIAVKRFDYRSADRRDVSIAVVGDVAVITGRVAMLVVAGDREVHLDSRFSSVWARADDRWRFVCWQSTPLPAQS